MADRYQTAVLFSMVKNVVYLSARTTFGTAGAGALDTNNSQGFCAFNPNTPVFSGATSSGSAVVSSITSFQGLFTGMALSGASIVGSGTFTIGTISASTHSISLSSPAALSVSASTSFVATGGQYILQLGTQSPSRLDTYAKLLEFDFEMDESTGSATGTVSQSQLAPSVTQCFMISNQTTIRTIPQTLTSGSTDASITVQFGNGAGVGFVAQAPTAGEACRFVLVMGNSTTL